MKKTILKSLTTLLAASCFAVEPSSVIEPIQAPNTAPSMHIPATSMSEGTPGFFYVRMNVANRDTTPQLSQKSLLPGLGLGYRRGEVSAIDITIKGDFNADSESYYWAFPKMSYLRYFTPHKKSSLYAGAGMIWGSLSRQETIIVDGEEDFATDHFLGLIPTACIGYEFNHSAVRSWRSFMELEVSQPALSMYREGRFPGPITELSIGFGY